MIRDHEHLRRLIREMGFGDQEEELMRAARPSIRVRCRHVNFEDEYQIPVGHSKVGGRADLPRDVRWARVETKYGSVGVPFIAQFNMKDVKPYDVENLLPESGLLSLFGDPWKLGHRARVLFSDVDVSQLERKPYPYDVDDITPDGGSERYAPCSVSFEPEVNLDYQLLQDEKFRDLLHASNYPPPYFNRLLGVTTVKENLRLQCQLLSELERLYDVPSDYETKVDNWQLLFQMDSDWNAFMGWKPFGGIICFYIRNLNFDDACLAYIER